MERCFSHMASQVCIWFPLSIIWFSMLISMVNTRLKVNTRSNASPVKTSPMIESLHKQNKAKPCATSIPLYSLEIKCQDEHVTMKKKIRPSMKKKTCKPHVVINSLMDRMANDVKLLDQKYFCIKLTICRQQNSYQNMEL